MLQDVSGVFESLTQSSQGVSLCRPHCAWNCQGQGAGLGLRPFGAKRQFFKRRLGTSTNDSNRHRCVGRRRPVRGAQLKEDRGEIDCPFLDVSGRARRVSRIQRSDAFVSQRARTEPGCQRIPFGARGPSSRLKPPGPSSRRTRRCWLRRKHWCASRLAISGSTVRSAFDWPRYLRPL